MCYVGHCYVYWMLNWLVLCTEVLNLETHSEKTKTGDKDLFDLGNKSKLCMKKLIYILILLESYDWLIIPKQRKYTELLQTLRLHTILKRISYRINSKNIILNKSILYWTKYHIEIKTNITLYSQNAKSKIRVMLNEKHSELRTWF